MSPTEGERKKGADINNRYSLRESIYGELTTPEAAEEKALAAIKKKKKKGFLGHENFYMWLYAFTEKHFVKKKAKEYELPDEVEFDLGLEDSKDKKKKPKKKKNKELPKEYREAFDFLGWHLDKNVVMTMPMIAAVLGLVVGLVISGVAFVGFTLLDNPTVTIVCGDGYCSMGMANGETEDSCPQDCGENLGLALSVLDERLQGSGGMPLMLLLILGLLPIGCLGGMMYYTQSYPTSAAESEKLRALTYVPEIMNYLIMKMRLKPNLETAVSFAADHGEGRIAEEFRILIWKNSVGLYDGIEEGLDEMAYKWEPYSEEFKHAITMIRASVLIPNDAERSVLYDKVIEDILESTKEKMESYARSMKQPSTYLFYIAILMPLMILIMLPVAAAFASMPIATAPILIALYIFAFPILTFLFARNILSKRPGGYTPPQIPDDYPGLPKKGVFKVGGISLPIIPLAIVLVILIILAGYFAEGLIKPTDLEVKYYLQMNPDKEVYPAATLAQYYLPLAFAIPLGFLLYAKSIGKKKEQDKVVRMEDDFKDAMYLLASRLGDKKPLEDCLGYVQKFMPLSPLATGVFSDIQRNIMLLGLTLRSAIFDPVYGAMKNVPSRLMDSSFRIMVDSIDLGPEVASYSLMSVSEQIRNTQRIKQLMRKLLDEVTGMMSSMATFIGPIILGMVASLQKVIVQIVPGTTTASTTSSAASSTGLFGSESLPIEQLMASDLEFQLIIAGYIIILAIILSYFTARVKYGDDKNAMLLTVGKSLPIAVLVFTGALYAGQMLMGGMAGG